MAHHTPPVLQKAYDTESFRELGHQLIELLADHIQQVQSDTNQLVIPYRTPDTELNYWQNHLNNPGKPIDLFKGILQHSINLHHPRYIGHQIAVPALISGLAGMMSDVLNNGTGVYEMGMASNAIERIVTDWVAEKIGYEKSASGLITSGGTLANLTALLAARKAKAPTDVWDKGHAEKLAIMVSEEAHYCVDRAAKVMGLGSEGIIKIPVDERFKIRTDLLEDHLRKAKEKGLIVIALIGCASTTATGSYDDLAALADFAEQHNLWYHIDGAHGGAVVFSEQYRHLAKGIERADSVVIDFHKMMLTPALNTALVFKRGADGYKTFHQRAQYLWELEQSPEWYHSGKRTFECTKLMLSIKVYAILSTYGAGIFEENINHLYGMGLAFAKMIEQHPDFEIAVLPEANIVNFRYINAPADQVNELNAAIRQELIESGKFYIVQTVIRDKRYLRTTVMNVHTQASDFEALLAEIVQIASRL